MSQTNGSLKAHVPAAKFFGFDHLNFWVGNAFQAASYYITRFGFEPLAYKGLETGSRDMATHVIRQGKVIFSFSSPYKGGVNAEFEQHLAKHGDGVRDVAFTVEDCRAIYNAAVANGATSLVEPHEESDDNGTVVLASIRTYGDTVHTLVERKAYKGLFLPGYVAAKPDAFTTLLKPTCIDFIDHIVGNQDWDGMTPVEDWYKEKLGFHRFWSVDDKQIHTEYSALRSVVVVDEDRAITMPINEPAVGKKKSQIEEYVDFYGGAGVQHIALNTQDIITTVAGLRSRGVQFLSVPEKYYTDLRKRLGASSVQVKEDLDTIQKLDLLVDFDDDGYLLQIFTKPVEDRPTLFIEIIQRANHDGFGVGNFKALFESIELEQDKRGNL